MYRYNTDTTNFILIGHASLLTLGNVCEIGMVTDVYKSKFSITF